MRHYFNLPRIPLLPVQPALTPAVSSPAPVDGTTASAPKIWPDAAGHPLTIDSTLADLATFRFEVQPGMLTGAVDDTFRQHSEIPGVLVVDGRQLLGVISRRRFFEILGQLYGTALFLKRPVEAMLDPVSRDWLQMSSATRIDEATRLIFERPERWVYEPIVVEFPDHTYRLLDVRALLFAQTHLFANLQLELRKINLELEDRVQLRTLELARINDNLQDEISRRRQVEEALTLARDEALAASHLKTELLAHVSHELRTPLGAILGFSEMLTLGLYGEMSEQQNEVATKIIVSSRYLENLVNDLLDQARLSTGRYSLNFNAFSPKDLLEPTLAKVRVMAEKKLLTLVADVAVDFPNVVSGDLVRLEQILLNLLNNAIKFTDQGAIGVRLYRVGQHQWAVEVADTGRGIPPEAQAYIFEPFRQVDGSVTRLTRGVGLGLSIVQQLVSLMNGHIHLKSEVGRGSTFTVVLPLHAELKAEAAPPFQASLLKENQPSDSQAPLSLDHRR